MRLWLGLILAASSAIAQDNGVPVLKTASGHSIQYYLSLPHGWTAQKTWPVVVVIEAAEREFRSTAELFAKARGDRPFILATPLVTTNGGPNYRQAPGYTYTEEAWKEIERTGRCTFDMEGIAAVARDIRASFGGADRYYVTGLEAGGHTVWALLFRHPEALRAVAPVATNFAGRCMEDGAFHAGVPDLPVRVFAGDRNPGWKAGAYLYDQSHRAEELAAQHGFRNVQDVAAPGKGHEHLADEVLAYFYSDWTGGGAQSSRPGR